jgi:hypothetical protein
MEYKNQKGIISIIAVLSIGIFALSTALIMAKGVLQQSATNHNNTSTYQAFYTAESGAGEGAYQFMNAPDDSPYTGGTLATLINDIPAEITVTSLPFSAAIINGKASKNDNSRNVLYYAIKHPEAPAFSYGIYTPYKIELNGHVTVNNGNVFAGEEVCCGGFKADGNCDKPYPENNCSNVSTDDVIKNEENTTPPSVDLQPYKNAAIANSSYFEQKTDIPNKYFKTPKNGVIFVNNSLTISESNAKITGALYVRGNLDLSGGTFTATDNYFAVIVEGDLKITGNAAINGVLYVKGNTEIGSGNVTINGSLICAGNTSLINAGGNLTVNYDTSLSNVWDDFVGLMLNAAPEIDRWNEE